MEFKPTQDRVLIRPEEGDTETAAGLILAQPQEAPPEGIVIAIGPDVTCVKEGNYVAYSKYGGHFIKIDGDDYLILTEKEILGVF